MLTRGSRSLFWVGLALVAMGVISIVWPGVTLSLVAAIFAVVAFVISVRQFDLAFSSRTAGPVIGHLLLALLDVAAGVVALFWPGFTVMALALWIGAWAVIAGVGEFTMAFRAGETAGERALLGLGGLLTVALGVVLLARPDVGAVSLAQVFGFFSLIYGGWSLVLAATTHSAASRIDSVVRTGA